MSGTNLEAAMTLWRGLETECQQQNANGNCIGYSGSCSVQEVLTLKFAATTRDLLTTDLGWSSSLLLPGPERTELPGLTPPPRQPLPAAESAWNKGVA
jgi:hypothetical protein